MQYDKINTKKHKHKQNESEHSEMGPVRNAHMCSRLCTTSVHNTAQKSSDNLPSYLQTTIIAQRCLLEKTIEKSIVPAVGKLHSANMCSKTNTVKQSTQ